MANFNLVSNPHGVGTKACAIASATVIEAGDAVTLNSGLITKAVATSTAIGIAAAPSAAGETDDIPVWTDESLVFEGTADANFAAGNRGAEVDLVGTANQQIDLGSSLTDVFKVEPGSNAGTVGSAAKCPCSY